MLPKPGTDYASPLHYTSVRLLNSLSEPSEKIILKRLNFQLRSWKLLSTTNMVLKGKGFNINKATLALFLDTNEVAIRFGPQD
jgi:hypothetical protein